MIKFGVESMFVMGPSMMERISRHIENVAASSWTFERNSLDLEWTTARWNLRKLGASYKFIDLSDGSADSFPVHRYRKQPPPTIMQEPAHI